MASFPKQNSYGFPAPYSVLPNPPIIAKRAPTSHDIGYPLGQVWIYSASNAAYILVSIASNSATWNLLESSGGSGVFTTLNVSGLSTLAALTQTGTANINTSGSAATNIGTGSNSGVVTIGNSASTGIDILVGSGGFALDGNGNAVAIANDAAANIVTLGSTTASASLTLQAGTGATGINLNAAGNVQVVPATDSQASPSAASTLNRRVGRVLFTGFTTASAGKQAFTITNSTVLANSGIFVTVANVHNSNDAQMTLTSVVVAAAGGSFVVNTTNNGAAALDGNVIISFWVIS